VAAAFQPLAGSGATVTTVACVPRPLDPVGIVEGESRTDRSRPLASHWLILAIFAKKNDDFGILKCILDC
jgi:hypothetical protein